MPGHIPGSARAVPRPVFILPALPARDFAS
jgi:hypothetical protein